MSHLVILPFDTVYTPKDSEFESTWHDLQTPVEGGIASDGSNIKRVFCNIVQTGIKADFDAEVSDVPEELQEFLGENPMTNWKLILADLRENGNGVIPLHVPKKGYQIHQNRLLFDTFIASAKQVLGNGFEIATVMTLGAYSQFGVSLAIKGENESFEVGKGDTWKCFYNLVSSHNGLVCSQRHLSMIRMVCMNTVQAAIASAEAQAMLKHTVNSLELITADRFAKDLQTWIDRKAEYKKTLSDLKSVSMTVEQFRQFAAGVFTQESSDELSTVSFNRIEEMASLFVRGKGNSGESAYDAINAFTEFFTSGNGVGKAGKVSVSKRVASANFGRGNEWKLEALRVACNPDELQNTLKRGAVLYGDKLIANAKG